MFERDPLSPALAEVFGDTTAALDGRLSPLTSSDRARVLNVLYHHSRNVDLRLEGAGASSVHVRALARESRRWTRGLYLLSLLELGRIGIDPSERPPPAVRAYDAWWRVTGSLDEEIARGVLVLEARILVHVGRQLRLFRATGWDASIAPRSPRERTPADRTLRAVRCACMLLADALTQRTDHGMSSAA
jgi:hypothetical protein